MSIPNKIFSNCIRTVLKFHWLILTFSTRLIYINTSHIHTVHVQIFTPSLFENVQTSFRIFYICKVFRLSVLYRKFRRKWISWIVLQYYYTEYKGWRKKICDTQYVFKFYWTCMQICEDQIPPTLLRSHRSQIVQYVQKRNVQE